MVQLAIIGGGPAGYTAAAKAAKAGMQVVLFEKENLGGTCLNVGCIPTKALLYSAKQVQAIRNAAKYGVQAGEPTFDYAKMVLRKQKVVRKLVAGIRQQLQGVEVLTGEAVVTAWSPEKVQITCTNPLKPEEPAVLVEAERLLICTGSTNFVPPIPGLQGNEHVWDSTDALAAKELPASVAIVGGGVIGMEFATLYAELGVPVTVVEAMPRILPNLDAELVAALQERYAKMGIRFLTGTKVLRLDEGRCIMQSEAEGEMTIEAEKILVSVGRRPCLAGLDALALETEGRGVRVDEHMLTSRPNVYAAGDVTGKVMLAHVAVKQAEVAVAHMLNEPEEMTYHAIPSVVYTHPELASVGLTEQDIQGREDAYEVVRMPMTYSGRFVAENEGENGLAKLIAEKATGRIVGVGLLGNPASEFLAVATAAVQHGWTKSQLSALIFPHPTVSEILKELSSPQ